MPDKPDFITSFLEWIGPTSIPRNYFIYAALSVLAACLNDRVWITKFIGNSPMKFFPNLYTMLLGPSGNGKSFALERALHILKQTDYDEHMGLWDGKLTAASLWDILGKQINDKAIKKPHFSKLYLVQDELSSCVGKPEEADQLVKMMTNLYYPKWPKSELTRYHGLVWIKDPYILNWFFTTGAPWLKEAISSTAIFGGLFGRSLVALSALVPPPDEVNKGHEDDADYYELEGSLVQHLKDLWSVEGEFERTESAWRVERAWLKDRGEEGKHIDPNRPDAPQWMREHDLGLRLAVLKAASEKSEGKVDGAQMAWAQKVARESCRTMVLLVDQVQSSRNGHAPMLHDIVREIKEHKRIQHSELLKIAFRRHAMLSGEVRGVVDTAINIGSVVSERKGRATVYVWKGK